MNEELTAKAPQSQLSRGTPEGYLSAQGILTDLELEAWQALRTVSLRLEDLVDHDLEAETDLSPSEFDVLVHLELAPDRTQRMAALARQTSLSPSRLSHTVDRLERRGLVIRSSCPKDRRGVEAALTDGGQRLLTESSARYFRAVREGILSRFSPQELDLLTDLLNRILDPA